MSATADQLVTREEAAQHLGYSRRTLDTYMARDPDRWPSPVAKRPNGAYVYELDALRQAAGVATTGDAAALARVRSSTVSDVDGLIVCLECDRRLRSLAGHLRTHDLTAAEYRARHQLPATASLAADYLRVDMQTERLARLAENPDDLAHLRAYHTAEHLDAMRERGIEVHRETMQTPIVREHRRPGQRQAVTAMVAARLAKMDAAVREHGYANVDEAVRDTLAMSAKAAGRASGLSPQTITRRRAGLRPRA